MARGKWVTDERRARIKKLVDEGLTNSQICQRLGMRQGHLCKVMQKMGVKIGIPKTD